MRAFRILRSWFSMVMALLVLTGCGEEKHSSFRGMFWRHPSSLVLPVPYTKEDPVPVYVQNWTMPPGFKGFPELWNRQVKEYLQCAVESCRKECELAMQQWLTATPGSETMKLAGIRFLTAWQDLQGLSRRAGEGDYLVFRRRNELPENLQWQDGMDEPELGSPRATKGGTLRLALQRSFPNTFRPFGPNSNNATRRYVYDDVDIPLVRLHPGTGALIPGTADRWAVSEDGRTVYFHIDENAKFSSGEALTTRDFVTSLFVRTSPYSAEPFYNDYYMANFSRIAIYGDDYLAVTLAAPRPHAPFYAAIPASCTPFYAEFGPDYTTRYLWRVAPTTGGYTVNPNGTIRGRQLTMSRVPNWWAANRKYTRYSCNVDHLVYSFVAETTKVRELFRIGQIDVFSARDADFWYEGLEMDSVHKGYVQRVHFSNIWPRSCFGFHLNCSRPPFNNVALRRGFHHALNIQLVIDTIFRGDYTRLGSYFSGFGEYTDESIKALPYSPEKAREFFAQAGYTEEGRDGILCTPEGERLQVVVSARIDPLYTNCMNVLREEAARCGLDLRLEQMDDTVLYSKVRNKKHEAVIFSWGFSPPVPDPASLFSSRFAYLPDGSPMLGTNNITATSSLAMDQAIHACRAARTYEQAVAAHHRVQQLVAESMAWVPGWTTSYWRFAQWRWVCWPDEPECRFCPPRYYDPMDSHLYWIDEKLKQQTLEARASGIAFPEREVEIPLPVQAEATRD